MVEAPIVWSKRTLSRTVRWSSGCVLCALIASCAKGVGIDEDVWVAPLSESELASEDGAGQGAEASEAADRGGDRAQQPTAGDLSDGDDSAGEGDEPDPEDEAQGSELEPILPVDVPIVDVEPDSEVDEPGSSGDPDPEPEPPLEPPAEDTSVPDPAQPEPSPPEPVTPGTSEPAVPGSGVGTDPGELPAGVLPAPEHCLAGWEGSSCDVCSGETQSDRSTCRAYIDCYIANDCNPGSCGAQEQVCGVNQIGNGLAPKEIADAVYVCLCEP